MTNSFLLTNAVIVTPSDVIQNGSLRVVNGKIDQINPAQSGGLPIIDAHGNFVMAGIIDIHTDALDAEIVPRPGADIPVALAFRELERKMSGCGFTTVYHSLHLGYNAAELNSRSKFARQEVFETVHRETQSRTLIKNKIHLRYELSGVDAYKECIEFMDKGYVSLLSIMDHTPGQGQMSKDRFIEVMLSKGKTVNQAKNEFEEIVNRPRISGERLEALITRAMRLNIPVASHDDDTIEKVDYAHCLGVKICEFPINLETAKRATELDMHVIGGASNVLRGGSLSGNVDMKSAILQKFVDSLCSDYYPPAILHSIFKLHLEEGMPLNETANLASLNPARAVGIDHETGSIAEGKDADLIIVKMNAGIPMVTHTIVRGEVMAQTSVRTNYQNVVNTKLETADAQ